MQKWTTFLMTLFVAGASFCANAVTGEVDFKAGYRHDNINWKNRFPSQDPVFKNSTRFKNIDIFQIGLNARATLGCNFYARAEADWGWILDGDFRNKFSVYESHRGSSESSNFFGSAFIDSTGSTFDDKYTYDANIGIGYAFWFCDCSAFIAPVIGYAVDVQNVNVDDVSFGSGSGQCCKHKYFSRWFGPFVGADFEYRPYQDCWNLYATFEYHWGVFKGKQNRTDGEESFFARNHHAWSSGWVFEVGAEYDLCNCWVVGLDLTFKDFTASKRRRFYPDFSGFSFNDNRRKNNDYWNSYAVSLTFGRQF